jgi:protein involved in polysaccharide export with SLBB domain
MFRPLVPFLSALVLLTSVAVSAAQTAPAGQPAPAAAAPAPPIQIPGVTSQGAAGASRAGAPGAGGVTAPAGYQLSPNDQIAVEVFGEDDLRTSAQLGGDGAVSLPLLGSVRLGGLTVTQAAARLTELYGRDYLVNPKVNVSLIGYAKARFTVLGQVNRPGSYEMPEGAPGGVDILEAIAMAGGYTRIAAPERISVRRKGTNGDEVIKVNAKKLTSAAGGGSFRVRPGDRITVGESIF